MAKWSTYGAPSARDVAGDKFLGLSGADGDTALFTDSLFFDSEAGADRPNNAGGNLVLNLVGSVASPVNYLGLSPAATGGGPVLASAGSDTNIPLSLNSKGSGSIVLATGARTITMANNGTLTLGLAAIDMSGSSAINPAFVPIASDVNTGLGSGGADQLSLTTGGVEAINIDASQVVTAANLLIRDDTYANIYVSAGVTAQTSITTAVLMTGFASDGPSNDCTAAVASDKITVTRAGDYRVEFSCSFTTSANNVVVTFTVYVNGSPSTMACGRKLGTGTDEGNVACASVLSIGASQDVEVFVSANSSTSVTPAESQLSVYRVGA